LKIKLSDYVAQKVFELGVRHVFMITGGGAMHLNHSLGMNNNLECIFNHHEQAAAMAAESYYRLTNKIALVNVTSGPGGTNTITGVHGAWTDSIGMVFLSGQVKYETTVRSTSLLLRQYGDQELDIEQIVKSITKYAVMVTDPNMIQYHLEKAFYLASNGRPGPCWLDIPLDIQGCEIETESLIKFDPSRFEKLPNNNDLNAKCRAIIKAIHSAERPVIFAGGGVRLSGAHNEFIKVIEKLNIPVVTGWNAHDVIWNSHSLYVGRPGTVGDRSGNFAVQNSDLLLILGSRLNIRQISYNWKSFAPKAYKIWVEIDPIELKKPTVQPDMPVIADLSDFLPILLELPFIEGNKKHQEWLKWCKDRTKRYPVVLPEYPKNKKINPYFFINALFEKLKENEIIVTANGTACVVGFQAAYLKYGQRLWTNSGCASMGYDLPAAIGACIGNNRKRVVCIAGDGSIMLNLQELQTIYGNNLPIKIFLLNNSGYASISQTQKNFFNNVEIGCGADSGLSFPNFEKISQAFNITYFKCENYEQISKNIEVALEVVGPIICEIFLDEEQVFSPKLSSKQIPDGTIISPNLEDMSPFLSKEELESNMLW
jgi:acetolactate synthase I/II/III large subunit